LENTEVGEAIILKFIFKKQRFEGETYAEGFRACGADGRGGKEVMTA